MPVISAIFWGGGSFADTTISDDFLSQSAYGGNIGWIDFRPDQDGDPDGVVVTETYLSGFAWSANWGWINFGDGTPANGYQYSNTDGLDFGVNLIDGRLSGLAWSANLGWLNFGWAEIDDPNGPRIDLEFGGFSGYAWSANFGWINLEAQTLATTHIVAPDEDGDGIGDAWEQLHFNGLTDATSTSDADNDGASDREEHLSLSDPNDPADLFRVVDFSVDNDLGSVEIEFTSSPGRVYKIYSGSDLSGLELDNFVPFVGDGGDTTTRRISFPTPSIGFFRVEVERPLLWLDSAGF